MKKLTKLFLSIIFTYIAFISLVNVNAYSTLSNYKPKYGNLTANVNFRTTASVSSGKLRTLTKGTPIKMVATIDSFYIVQLGTNEIGAVSKNYVKSASAAPKGASTYTTISKKIGTTKSSTILRGGPGTNFRKITTLSSGTKVTIIGYIGNWYIVATNNNLVGCIREDLLNTQTSNTTTSNSSNVTMSENEKTVFNLINNARTKAGIAKLLADATTFKVARLKSQDMVKSNYFAHNSPTYGSPFKMLSTYGVSYKAAGENIAGNPSLEAAVNAWLNSATHKQNILSNSYNYIGIGIEKSDTYGYIITAMFIR